MLTTSKTARSYAIHMTGFLAVYGILKVQRKECNIKASMTYYNQQALCVETTTTQNSTNAKYKFVHIKHNQTMSIPVFSPDSRDWTYPPVKVELVQVTQVYLPR